MTILSRLDQLAGAFGLEPKAGSPRRPQLPPWATERGFSDLENPDMVTYQRQAEQYRSSASFAAAMNRIAEAAATVRLAVFNGPDDDATVIAKHPFLELLRNPAPGMSWLGLDRFTTVESLVMAILGDGDAYLYLGGRTSNRRPPGLVVPLRPDRVQMTGQGGMVDGYLYTMMGHDFRLPMEDVVHFRRYNPLSDVYGMGAAEPAFMAIEADVNAQRHNRALFKNQARMSFIVESEQDFVDDEQRNLMERWFKDAFTGGPDKAGQVAFLWAGFKAKDTGQNLRDAEYINGRKMNREDIFMAMGVHPALMLSDDVPLANARTAEYLLGKYTILPLMTRICNRLNADLMPLYGESHTLRALDVVPRDVQQQVQQHTQYLDRAVLTINEVRNDLGMDPAPWGDVTWPEYQGRLEPAPVPQIIDGDAVDQTDVQTPKLLEAGEVISAEMQALFTAAARTVSRG